MIALGWKEWAGSVILLPPSLFICITVRAEPALRAVASGVEPRWLTPVGRGLFFSGRDDDHGRELWHFDGVEGRARLVVDLFVGSESASPVELGAMGKRVVFLANRGPDSPIQNREVWWSDGTPGGTMSLVNPAASPSIFYKIRELEIVQDRAYWCSDTELWVRGTDAPQSVAIRRYDQFSNGHRFQSLTAAGELVYYLDWARGELWTTNGTAQGTRRVRQFPASQRYWDEFEGGGGRLFFRVHDSSLWTSDGSDAGTKALIAHLGNPRAMFSWSSELVFSQDDGVHGREPWISDGTESGTRLLADLAPGARSSHPDFFTTVGEDLYFVAGDGQGHLFLWVAEAPWNHVRQVLAVAREDSEPCSANLIAAPFEMGVILTAQSNDRGRELVWVPNRKEVVPLPEVIPGPADGAIRDLVRAGLDLYFVADGELERGVLWHFDLARPAFAPRLVECLQRPGGDSTSETDLRINECRASFDSDSDGDIDLADWADFERRIAS